MSAHNHIREHDAAPWEQKDPGASAVIPNDKSAIYNIVTGASGETNTLAAPVRAGVRIGFNLLTDGGGDRVITVASAYDAGGQTTITLADAGDYVELLSRQFTAGSYRWVKVFQNGIGEGDQFYTDDEKISFGNSQDVELLWETADANANKFLIELPAGGSVNVPVIVIGQAIENVDMAIHNGVVDPLVSMIGTGAVTTGPVIELRKARGTATAPTVVTAGDDTGIINFYNCVAAGEWVLGAQIRVDAQATLATTRGPTQMVFATATDAAPSVLTDALTISKAQLVTCAAGLTVTTGTLTLTAGPAILGEGTLPAGTNCYIGRDNSGDTVINAITGKTVNIAINGSDIITVSATVMSFTGTIAATGARVTQAYFTNHTTTNAETVDSSATVKTDIQPWDGDALAVLEQAEICTFKHERWLDPSGETKLGMLAESIKEPLALRPIEREGHDPYPGLNMYGLATLNTRAIQQLAAELREEKKEKDKLLKRLEALEKRP